MILKDVQVREVVREPGSGSNYRHYSHERGWVLIQDADGVWIISQATGAYRWVPVSNVLDATPWAIPDAIKTTLKTFLGTKKGAA